MLHHDLIERHILPFAIQDERSLASLSLVCTRWRSAMRCTDVWLPFLTASFQNALLSSVKDPEVRRVAAAQWIIAPAAVPLVRLLKMRARRRKRNTIKTVRIQWLFRMLDDSVQEGRWDGDRQEWAGYTQQIKPGIYFCCSMKRNALSGPDCRVLRFSDVGGWLHYRGRLRDSFMSGRGTLTGDGFTLRSNKFSDDGNGDDDDDTGFPATLQRTDDRQQALAVRVSGSMFVRGADSHIVCAADDAAEVQGEIDFRTCAATWRRTTKAPRLA